MALEWVAATLNFASHMACRAASAVAAVADGLKNVLASIAARRGDRYRDTGRLGFAAVLVTVPVLFLLLAPIVITAWASVATHWVSPGYDYMLERYAGVAVFDSRGRYLGAIPGAMEPWADFESPDHKSLYVDRVPQAWLTCLEHLEDRHRKDPWRSRYGVDVPGFFRAAIASVGGGGAQGASTLPMQVVRSLHHRAADPREPVAAKLGRKLTEILHAPVLVRSLDADGPGSLERAFAMHLPLVVGAAGSGLGGTLYGLGTASWTLFGLPPHELSAAHQALLAAAVHRPIVIAPADDSAGVELAERRWSHLQRRARQCVGALARDAAGAARLRADINAATPPEPWVDPAMAGLLPADPHQRTAMLGNPFRRAMFFARSELVQAMAELRERFGPDWRGKVTAIHLTVDAAVSVRVRIALDGRLSLVEREHPTLAGRLRTIATGLEPQILVAVADERDRIVAFYSNYHSPVYSGVGRGADGSYDPSRETRQTGSVSKYLIALRLGLTDQPTDRYCNAAVRGVRNPDGGSGTGNCAAPGGSYAAEEVFSRSLNLPLLARTTAADDDALEALANELEIVLPEGVAARSALTLGLGAASPQRLHRMVGVLMQGVAGRDPTAVLPHLLDSVTVVRGHAIVRGQATGSQLRPPVVAGYFPASRAYFTRVMSAPLAPGGTLQRLGAWRAGLRKGVTAHIGKTGTTVAPRSSGTLDAYALGGLLVRGQRYTYVALVGSPDPGHPVGKGFHGGHTAPLVAATLDILLGDHK